MDCSPTGSSVHGILQARILGWVAFPFFRGSSCPRDRTPVSCIPGGFFTADPLYVYTGVPGGSDSKESAVKESWEMEVQSLSWEDPLEKGMATHSRILLLEKPMDRGACWATVHGVTKSRTRLRQLCSLYMFVYVCLCVCVYIYIYESSKIKVKMLLGTHFLGLGL